MLASTPYAALRPLRSSIARSHRTFCSSSSRLAGSFRSENGVQIYHERKILPQLYAIVADTDAYQRFIPFVTSSKVLRHEGPGKMQEQPWLDLDNGQGDTHKMEHEMRVGAMGFDETWVSHVTCEKFRQVSAESRPSGLFKTLKTTWTLSPAPSNTSHPSSQPLPQASSSLGVPGQPSDNLDVQKDGEGPTLVSIDLAWQFANPLYAAAAGTAFQRVSSKILGAFEKRAKDIHGEGKQ